MTVVVDASVALAWVLPEETTSKALALRTEWEERGEYLLAPPSFRSEVTNAAHQRVRRKEMTLLEAVEAVDVLLHAVAIDEPPGLYRRALDLASAYSLDSTYDALYLALADERRCSLFTADRRFARAVKGSPVQVRWTGGPV